MDISIVIPVYNEKESLKTLYAELKEVLLKMNSLYEIIFIDDGSIDGTFDILSGLNKVDKNVKVIQLRKNYGKSTALSAGFDKAIGKIVISMDGDLQDSPEEILRLIKKIEEGYDLVSGWKFNRKDPLNKTIPSFIFNKFVSLYTGIKIHDINCGLKAYKLEVIKNIDVYGELHRFLPVLSFWQGFKVGEIKVDHRKRKYGKSKFGTWRFFSGFFDFITVMITTRYLYRQLHLFGFVGLALVSSGFLINFSLAVTKYTVGLTLTETRPLLLLVLGIFMIIIGLQMFLSGLLGEIVFKLTGDKKINYVVKNVIG